MINLFSTKTIYHFIINYTESANKASDITSFMAGVPIIQKPVIHLFWTGFSIVEIPVIKESKFLPSLYNPTRTTKAINC